MPPQTYLRAVTCVWCQQELCTRCQLRDPNPTNLRFCLNLSSSWKPFPLSLEVASSELLRPHRFLKVHYGFLCLSNLPPKLSSWSFHSLPVSFHTETQTQDPAQNRAVDWLTHGRADQCSSGVRNIWSWGSDHLYQMKVERDQVGPCAGLIQTVFCLKWQKKTGTRWSLRICSVLWIYDRSKQPAKGTDTYVGKGIYLVILSFFSELFLPQHPELPLKWYTYQGACVNVSATQCAWRSGSHTHIHTCTHTEHFCFTNFFLISLERDPFQQSNGG